MQHKSTLSKLLLTILAMGIILWLGGAIIRTAIAYDLYVPSTQMVLKPDYTDAMRMQTVRLFTVGALYSEGGFLAAFICSVILCVHWRKLLKLKGWLFMAFFMFFLTVPAELYFSILDYKLGITIFYGGQHTFNDPEIQKLFANRLSKLSQISPMIYLAIFTSIIMVIWQPLNKKKEELQVS